MCADPLLDFLKQCQNDGLGSTPENSVVCMGNEAVCRTQGADPLALKLNLILANREISIH